MTITVDHLHALAEGYTNAWNTGRPEAVASFFSLEGAITINGGEPWRGREGVAAMAAGFFADVPDMSLVCDGVRGSGGHAVYLWTFTGNHAVTKRQMTISGWEEWDLSEAAMIDQSSGHFDAEKYARQAGL
jgi:uncharacterized protein (TIGR02246 family)